MLNEPDWKNNSNPFIESITLPTQWHGLPIEWETGYIPIPVFITQFTLFNRDIYVFGVRYETSKAFVKGKNLPVGYFIEYIILEYSINNKSIHYLKQNKSATYSVNPEKNDYIAVSDMKKNIKELSLGNPPLWKIVDAQWPTFNGKLMFFLGQVSLIENEITKFYLTWDKILFIFYTTQADDKNIFKITTQDIDYQSIDEHYNLE